MVKTPFRIQFRQFWIKKLRYLNNIYLQLHGTVGSPSIS